MPAQSSIEEIRRAAVRLAEKNRRAVFVTLAERGLVGALPDGRSEHVAALALRGPIDVVGAGDSVTANLATALAAGAELREALSIAALASSIVIHQLGTSGSASVAQMAASALPAAAYPDSLERLSLFYSRRWQRVVAQPSRLWGRRASCPSQRRPLPFGRLRWLQFYLNRGKCILKEAGRRRILLRESFRLSGRGLKFSFVVDAHNVAVIFAILGW